VCVETHDDLLTVLDDVVPTLAARTEPLVLEVAVVPETTFAPGRAESVCPTRSGRTPPARSPRGGRR
jgi:hypothetical protein